MTKSADAVQNGFVLRLSVPLTGAIAGVGPEMAVKLAEQIGLDGAAAGRVGDALAELGDELDRSAPGDASFEFVKLETALKIEARHGTHVAERRVPLRD